MDQKFIIDKQGRKRKATTRKCHHCLREFLTQERFVKQGRGLYCSRNCSNQTHSTQILLSCHNCNKKIYRSRSQLEKSKHKVFFCSRKCKEHSQSLKGNCPQIRPRHYGNGNGKWTYRKEAFNTYKHQCAIKTCGWNEDIQILDVHHIDGNRNNNNINNLIILCPICHTKITRGHYKLHDRNKLI